MRHVGMVERGRRDKVARGTLVLPIPRTVIDDPPRRGGTGVRLRRVKSIFRSGGLDAFFFKVSHT